MEAEVEFRDVPLLDDSTELLPVDVSLAVGLLEFPFELKGKTKMKVDL